MSITYDQAWTCTCGTENLGRLICSRCNELHPFEGTATTVVHSDVAPSPLSARAERVHPAHLARRSRPLVRIVVTALVFLALGGAWVAKNADDDAQKRVENYLHGFDGASFVASDLQFRATFPNMPARDEDEVVVAGQHLRYTMYTSGSDDDAFVVAAYRVPAGTSFDLNGAVNGAAAAVDGQLSSATPTSFIGVDAVEALIGISGGHIKMLVFRVDDRAFMLYAVGKDNPPGGYDRLKESFSLM